jgi:hypothetical protein
MLTIHWNGDRDEVEDFEFTFRSLQGSGDCDGVEDIPTACMGALVPARLGDDERAAAHEQRRQGDVEPTSAAEPEPPGDERLERRRAAHARGGLRLLAHRLREEPEQPNDATERGRAIFSDPLTRCAECHRRQDRAVLHRQAAGAAIRLRPRPRAGDTNNPFLRHDVGPGNIFDNADPYQVGLDGRSCRTRTCRSRRRAGRSALRHAGARTTSGTRRRTARRHAHTLLDVVRPCDRARRLHRLGRRPRIHERQPHGKTDILTPKQLNDLVAFQNALTTATELGARNNVVKAGTMSITNAKLTFGKVKNGTRGPASFKFVGTFGGAPVAANLAGGVALQLATPGGGTMVLFERTIPMQATANASSARRRTAVARSSCPSARRADTSRSCSSARLWISPRSIPETRT